MLPADAMAISLFMGLIDFIMGEREIDQNFEMTFLVPHKGPNRLLHYRQISSKRYGGFAFSRCLNGTFPSKKCSVKTMYLLLF